MGGPGKASGRASGGVRYSPKSEKSLRLVWIESSLREDDESQANVFSERGETLIQMALGNSFEGQQLRFSISTDLAVSAHTYTPRLRRPFLEARRAQLNWNHP